MSLQSKWPIQEYTRGFGVVVLLVKVVVKVVLQWLRLKKI